MCIGCNDRSTIDIRYVIMGKRMQYAPAINSINKLLFDNRKLAVAIKKGGSEGVRDALRLNRP